MKKIINKIFKTIGYQIKKYPDSDLRRRIRIVNDLKIDTILDIGANIGQFSLEMRDLGYRNKIISFEPLRSAFVSLKKKSLHDPAWSVYNIAIGSENKKDHINISANSYSSSILGILPSHIAAAPDSKYIGKEEVDVRTLDSVFEEFCKSSDNIMIKIDTQGYENEVLKGAEKILHMIKLVELEMSISPLYENEVLFFDMCNILEKKGFFLCSLENGFYNYNSGRLLQVDGMFINKTFCF